MKENSDKTLDDFVRRSVKEAGLDSPSDSFTDTLLSKIEASGLKADVTAYKPLISKTTWGILVMLVAALSVLAMYGTADTEFAWLEKMNMGALPKLKFLEAIPSLAISNTLFYSILIFAVFAAFQVYLLKQRLNRRYV